MKIKEIILLFGLMLLFSSTISTFAMQESINIEYITNGGFESGDISPWYNYIHTATYNVQSSLVHEGVYSLQYIVPSVGSNYMIYNEFFVDSGSSYTYTGWIYDNDANGYIILSVYHFDDYSVIGSFDTSDSTTDIGWQQLTITDTLPQRCNMVQLRVSFVESAAPFTGYVDDLSYDGAISEFNNIMITTLGIFLISAVLIKRKH